MELMKAALFIALLTATSARPMGWRRHQDADIPDKDWTPGWPGHNSRWASRSSESFSREDSSESSESRSSEESSEDILISDATTPTTTTEGSTLSPSPDAPNTDETPVMETATPEEGGQSTPGTPPPCDQCFTVEIPTEGPTTNKRGDN